MIRRLSLLLIFLAVPATAREPLPTYPPPAEVKAAFLKLLDRPRVPLDPQVKDLGKDGTLTTEHFSIATERKADGAIERVAGLLYKQAGQEGKRPAVLVLHGTGGTKEGQKDLLRDLANRGLIAVAIDGRYHGERAGGAKGTTAYNDAITRAWRAKPGEPQEHPFYYDTCWDIWRTADYLCGRPDVDPERLGIIGFSKGGIETWLAAAVDERFKVAVPAIAVQSFRWSLENGQWQGRAKTIQAAHAAAAHDLGEAEVNSRVCRELWGKVIPDILGRFDGPSMLRLFVGRRLLILNGEKDPNCPIEGARLAIAAAEDAFRQAGAADRLKVLIAPGVGHQVTKEQRAAAVAWLAEGLVR
jgi:dienelactone hydrolase